MSYSPNKVTLGSVLQQSGLVSAEQVDQALKQKQQSNSNLSIGEILANEGKISPKTVDFFVERWLNLAVEKPRQPIGQYLKQAALLNEQQIQTILAEQQNSLHSKLKFGEIAIAKGWIKQTTIDFFLTHLKTKSGLSPTPSDTPSISAPAQKNYLHQPIYEDQGQDSQKVHQGFLQIKRKLLNIEGQGIDSEKTLERVLFWTGGHSLMTQKIFSLISQNPSALSPQEEEQQIDELIQTKIIDHWSNNELKSHLRTIKNRLLNNQQCSSNELLKLYQKILTTTVLVDDAQEQKELLNSGIVVQQNNKLVVTNRIYESVFNQDWVIENLNDKGQLAEDRTSSIPSRADDLTTVTDIVKVQESKQAKDRWFNLKNILLLLTLLGLLGVFFNNISQRIMARNAFQQGNKLLKQKSYSGALAAYNKLLNIDSNYFQAWTNRGYALAGLQEFEAMRESCSTATIINPTAVYAWNCQGEALHNLQRDQEAIAAFDQAIALTQTDPIFLINKSEALASLGNSKESIDAINQAIKILEQIEMTQGATEIAGEFSVALTFMGNHYRKQEKFNQAIATYERAINYTPNYFPAHIGKGISLTKAQRPQEAEAEFRNMLHDTLLTEAQQAQTWFYLGKTLCQAEPGPDSIAAFNRAIELKPDYEIAKEARKNCRLLLLHGTD